MAKGKRQQEPVKTSWEKTSGNRTDYIDVHYNKVIVGHHYQTGMSDIAGDCSHEEFLAGQFQGLIHDTFGPGVLKAVMYAVEHSYENTDHNKKRENVAVLRHFLNQFPADPALGTIINNPGTINGADVYGNLGGYKSRIESDTTILTYESTKGDIVHKKTGNKINFTLDFHISRCVELHDTYYITGGDNFHVLSSGGKILFTTDRHDLLFGYVLRFGNVLRNNGTIAVSYWWISSDYPAGFLRYEPGKGFTGRWEVPG
jgi:hypothetical protein